MFYHEDGSLSPALGSPDHVPLGVEPHCPSIPACRAHLQLPGWPLRPGDPPATTSVYQRNFNDIDTPKERRGNFWSLTLRRLLCF